MTQHDAAQDLAYIRQVMEQSRRYTAAQGIFFVIWGVAVSFALLLTWLQILGHISGNNLLIWGVVMVAAWGLTIYCAWQQDRSSATPYHAQLIGMNWTAVGVAMGLAFFVGVPTATLSLQAIPGLSALFVGVGILNTGHLSSIRWLAVVGVVWLLCGALMLAWPGVHNILATAVLLFAGQIVPGLILMREERARRAQAGGAAHG
jgi:hypothetical protein